MQIEDSARRPGERGCGRPLRLRGSDDSSNGSGPIGQLAVLVLGVALLVGCASSAPDQTGPPPLSQRARDYLVSPMTGFSPSVAPDVASSLERGYDQLARFGDRESARDIARTALARDAELLPALVLSAQADFADELYPEVVESLQTLLDQPAEETPYTAGLLVLARAAELSDRPVLALAGYRRIGDLPRVARRLEIVEPAALQELGRRLVDELARSRVDLAEETLVRLQDWAPESPVTFEASRALAVAVDDPLRELEALRHLQPLQPESRPLTERLARLEVDIGRPERGVQLFEQLVTTFPEDQLLEDGLASARFRWRFEMLPEEVGELIGAELLTRGDFATLLYWLVPGVRSGSGGSGRIATDLPLEHPQRQAIVRVLNAELMSIYDATLRRFEPDRTLTRSDALESLLGVPERLRVRAACTETYRLNPRPTVESICETAARCGMIESASECRPAAEITGAEAREMIRYALALLEGASP